MCPRTSPAESLNNKKHPQSLSLLRVSAHKPRTLLCPTFLAAAATRMSAWTPLLEGFVEQSSELRTLRGLGTSELLVGGLGHCRSLKASAFLRVDVFLSKANMQPFNNA